MAKLLLRFREFKKNRDTISEHQTIIDKYDYVWWGWWKKINEPDREKEIALLKKELKDNPIHVGLFNRDQQRYFKAQAKGIYYVHGKDIKSMEPRKTPRYYRRRKIPFWIKLSNIEEISLKELQEKFNIPRIPGGDYTFFYVDDLRDIEKESEKDFIKGPYELNIKSTKMEKKSVKEKIIRILHISDLHFGDDHAYQKEEIYKGKELLSIVNSNLRNTRIDLLIISGDLISKAAYMHLKDAKEFIDSLCSLLDIKKEQVIIVPGNHDIKLNEFIEFNFLHNLEFEGFLERFYGENTKLFGLHVFNVKGIKGLESIEILRINSAQLRSYEYKDYGYIGWDNYDGLLDGKLKEKSSNTIRIAVLHHHLVSMTDIEKLDENYKLAGFSITLDAGKVIKGLQKYNFDLVLHGHQHIAALTKISKGIITHERNLIGLEKPISICSGGSLGSKRLSEALKYNTFNLIEISEENIDIRAIEFNTENRGLDYFRTTIKRIK